MLRQHHRGSWRQRGDKGFQQRRGRGSTIEESYALKDCFLIRHPMKYEEEAPPLHPPTVLGSFSVDSEKNIRFDKSMMPVLSRKYITDSEFMKVDMDLNTGWHRVNNFTGTSTEGFKLFLQWILENQEKVRAMDLSNRLAADFVCSRRLLKQIMHAPYQHGEHNTWIMYAEYFKGTIYLANEAPGQEKHREEAGASLMDIYGHKFEHYMTGGNPADVLECNCQFRCVLQLHLNEMSLLFAPDTDGVDQTLLKEDFKDMSSFVRLKTRSDSTSPRTLKNYKKFYLNNWWIENMLTGVPRLVIGSRNQEGIVHTLQMLKTDDFPSLAQGEWEPSVCINILDKFLDFVKRKVLAEPEVVHCFERSALALRQIHHFCDPNLKDILPTWYKQKLFVTKDVGAEGRLRQ